MRPGDDETPDLEHLVIRLGKQLRHRRAASLEPFGLVAHQARAFLSVARAADRFGLTARGYHRVLRVARTIADLDESGTVRRPHVAEALSYRLLSAKEN